MTKKKINVSEEHQTLIKDWYKNDPERIFIVSGAAGCGKTTLIRHIPEILGIHNVQFLAPTGKAAKVVGAHARTIHSFLYIPVPDGKGGIKEWIPKDVSDFEDYGLLIADEISMVNDDMLMDLRNTGVPIIGSGDPFQLPPVNGTNEILQQADIMLLKVWRNDGGILDLATDIRKRNKLKWSKYNNVTVNFTGVYSDYDRIDENSVVLCKFNKTRQEFNHRYRKEVLGYQKLLVVGEKLIITRNNKKSGLRNGSIVTCTKILKVDRKTLTGRIEVKDEEGYVYEIYMNFDQIMLREERTFRVPTMHYLDFAYALTCHKAQGSEYDKVFVINEGKNFKDHKSWLYTAVTRAKKEVHIYF